MQGYGRVVYVADPEAIGCLPSAAQPSELWLGPAAATHPHDPQPTQEAAVGVHNTLSDPGSHNQHTRHRHALSSSAVKTMLHPLE
jgi:hypothetical protein